jgi:hypothetical protein
MPAMFQLLMQAWHQSAEKSYACTTVVQLRSCVDHLSGMLADQATGWI